MRSLIRLSINKPITMLMIITALVVFGVYTFRMMSMEIMPKVDIPVVTITTIYPGAGPEEIETSVTEKLEDAFSLLDGVDLIYSYQMEGVSIITIQFNMGLNVDFASIDVKDKINEIRRELPDAIEDPVVTKFDIGDKPVLSLALTGDESLVAVKKRAEDIQERLAKVSGVAAVNIEGGVEREILVELSKTEMEARGLSYESVFGIIRASNLNFPLGNIENQTQDINVRINSKFVSLDQLNELEIPTKMGVVQLKHIARVTDTYKEQVQDARYNEVTSVGLSIKKRADANIINVADKIKKKLKVITAGLPEGYTLSVAKDNSIFVNNSVNDVYVNIIFGIILTAIVLLVFLRKMSITIIAATTMPISIIGTVTFMYGSGFTFNMMSLMAIGIAVGILVTNSIVVLENIIKHMGRGDDPKKSAEEGTIEIATAVIASTLTNVAVFVPIAFMQSIVGAFFVEFGMTMVYVTGVSLFVSFTLTPMMASRMLHNRNQKEIDEFADTDRKGLMHWIEQKYEYGLELVLTRLGTIVTSIVVLLLFASIGIVVTQLGGEFVPKSDEGTFEVKVELPSGTNLETSNRAVAKVEEVLRDVPELVSQYATIGTIEGLAQGGHLSFVVVQLKDKSERDRSTEEIVADLRTQMVHIPDASIIIKSIKSTGGDPNASDLDVEIVGTNMDNILEAVDSVSSFIAAVPGVADMETNWKSGKPELVLRPRRNAVADYGVTVGQIAQTIRMYVVGDAATQYREGVDEYDVTVKFAESDRKKRSDILSLPILSPRGVIPLASFVEESASEGPTTISRKNKERMVKISTNLVPGMTPGDVQKQLDPYIESLNLKGDTRITFGGNAEMMADAAADFLIAIVMAIILTYVLLTALLESFLQPIIIMSTIPLGLIGVIWSLFLSGSAISIISLMAIVMLIGIVVNNGILILDYANHLMRNEGLTLREAAIKGAASKFRAIVMTNIATIMAMMPLALGLGAGAEMRQPMAIASIGGLIVSTTLTLFFVPMLYWVFARFGMKES
ncbi:MAG: efflux RND transporter permease subunit [Fibrobacterales bacterium]